LNKAEFTNIIDYIEGHLSEDINLDELSRAFYISKYHLLRVWKSLTGMGIIKYIANRRLSASVPELIKGEASVSFIANKYGFSTPAYIRAFKRMTGQTPGHFCLKADTPLTEKVDPKLLFGVHKGILSRYPNIQAMPELHLCGKKYIIDNRENELNAEALAVGMAFFEEAAKIQGAIEPQSCYIGLVDLMEGDENSNAYYPSTQITPEAALPEGLHHLILPAGKYQIFTYVGMHSIFELHTDYLHDLWDLILSWNPNIPFWYERIQQSRCSDEICEIEFVCPARS
jgi:AraC family transcriptional regulator